jgi:non-ribosomal peptide synthase protein (TIGR01720 family)
LLPIQQWYFQLSPEAISHYNQSVLLGIDKNIPGSLLAAAFKQLSGHHDALRFVYRQVAGQWEQAYGTKDIVLEVEDLQSCNEASLKQTITDCANNWQRSLDITKGELVRAIWMQTPVFESHNRLLIVVHHLAMDGVSWRILLEDLQLLLNGWRQGQTVNLGKKTCSYRQWYEGLASYAQRRWLLSQSAYWERVVLNRSKLPVDIAYEGRSTAGDMHHITVKLEAGQTRLLLQEVPPVYHTEVNDLLLAALGTTLAEWCGQDNVIIGLEGHGRENSVTGFDSSRTIGWFTSMYAVMLNLEGATEATDIIKTVKEQLRQIPDKGIGYGVLKYINRLSTLQGNDPWEIVFNYLGQSDNIVSGHSILTGAGESAGIPISLLTPVTDKIQVNSRVTGKELVMRWSYSSRHFHADTIAQLANRYIHNLVQLIDHCVAVNKLPIGTPSDYGLTTALTYRELDDFLAAPIGGKQRKEVMETMCRLSGLQEGLLFHGLYDNNSGAYIDQTIAEIQELKVNCFIDTWNQLLQRHSILRTAFYHDIGRMPVQVVYRDVKMPVEILDYRHLNDQEQELQVRAFEQADLCKGLDLKTPPLMRLSLIQLKDDRYRMIWTHHHLITDGWSGPILMEEFLQVYDKLLLNEVLQETPEDRYEDYIRYIEKRDKEQEENYWRKYLQGLQQATLLPFIATGSDRTREVAAYQAAVLDIDEHITKQIRAYAKQFQITVNTIMQGVWAWLLHRYTGNANVVYGVTVSGRPEDLPETERRVGLYINTIPLHSVLNEEQDVVSWLQAMHQQQWQSREYQYTSLSAIQAWTGIKGELFDTMMLFQNYPVSRLISQRAWQLQIAHIQVQEQTTNYPLSIRIAETEKITIHFIYKEKLLEKSFVLQLSAHFRQVLYMIIQQPDAKVKQLNTDQEHELTVKKPEILKEDLFDL